MDDRREVQQFLTAARARLTPERAGIPVFGGDRRVPGLRREEVAQLAGVSTDYYTKIERGAVGGVSDAVLLAIARALQLDETETTHLRNLGRASATPARRRRARPQTPVPERLAQLVDAMPDVPVVAHDRLSVPVASNPLGRALFPHLFPEGTAPLNHALYIFLDPRARTFYADWDTSARAAVAAMRLAAWQKPDDAGLMALVGRLTTQSRDFSDWWDEHRVGTLGISPKQIHHPIVGPVTLAYLNLVVPTAPGITISAYLTDPGTSSADALDVLRAGSPSPRPHDPTRHAARERRSTHADPSACGLGTHRAPRTSYAVARRWWGLSADQPRSGPRHDNGPRSCVSAGRGPFSYLWAILGSNQRPLPCQGSALPLR